MTYLEYLQSQDPLAGYDQNYKDTYARLQSLSAPANPFFQQASELAQSFLNPLPFVDESGLGIAPKNFYKQNNPFKGIKDTDPNTKGNQKGAKPSRQVQKGALALLDPTQLNTADRYSDHHLAAMAERDPERVAQMQTQIDKHYLPTLQKLFAPSDEAQTPQGPQATLQGTWKQMADGSFLEGSTGQWRPADNPPPNTQWNKQPSIRDMLASGQITGNDLSWASQGGSQPIGALGHYTSQWQDAGGVSPYMRGGGLQGLQSLVHKGIGGYQAALAPPPVAARPAGARPQAAIAPPVSMPSPAIPLQQGRRDQSDPFGVHSRMRDIMNKGMASTASLGTPTIGSHASSTRPEKSGGHKASLNSTI